MTETIMSLAGIRLTRLTRFIRLLRGTIFQGGCTLVARELHQSGCAYRAYARLRTESRELTQELSAES